MPYIRLSLDLSDTDLFEATGDSYVAAVEAGRM